MMTETELYQYALFLLSRRDYGSGELRNRMKQRAYEKNEGNVDENIIDNVIQQFIEREYIDDKRIVSLFLQSYVRKSYGPLRIKQSLRQKGFSAELIDMAFETVEIDWFELAAEVRVKKFGEEIPTDFKLKAKQIRYLQYKGFSGDTIFEQFN